MIGAKGLWGERGASGGGSAGRSVGGGGIAAGITGGSARAQPDGAGGGGGNAGGGKRLDAPCPHRAARASGMCDCIGACCVHAGAAASCRPVKTDFESRRLLFPTNGNSRATCHAAVANLQSSMSARIVRRSARVSRFWIRHAKTLPANSIAFSDRLPNSVWLQIQSRASSATIFLHSRISH